MIFSWNSEHSLIQGFAVSKVHDAKTITLRVEYIIKLFLF